MATKKKKTAKGRAKKKKTAAKSGKRKSATGKAAKRTAVKTPERREQLYEGKAKLLYATSDPDKLICYFKDDATAFNALKKGTILDKGVFNNAISASIYERLEKKGIRTHLVAKLSDREQLVHKVEIIPVEVIVRNVAAGSLAKRLGLEEGIQLKKPAVEFCYKSDPLGDPFISKDIPVGLGWATEKEMDYLYNSALVINKFLSSFFLKLGIKLIDFKLEFGRHKGKILLADEITPDGCRLWDSKTNEKLDKDRFRRDLGNIEQAYARVHKAVLSAK